MIAIIMLVGTLYSWQVSLERGFSLFASTIIGIVTAGLLTCAGMIAVGTEVNQK